MKECPQTRRTQAFCIFADQKTLYKQSDLSDTSRKNKMRNLRSFHKWRGMKGAHTCVVQVKLLPLGQCKQNNSGYLAAGVKLNGTLQEKNLITFFWEKGNL